MGFCSEFLLILETHGAIRKSGFLRDPAIRSADS
jgi:hypothetical protein